MTEKTYTHGHGYSKWTEILDKEATAPESGLYLFAVRSDNHISYDLVRIDKDENLIVTYQNKVHHSNITIDDISNDDLFNWGIPVAYHFIPEYTQGSVFWRLWDVPVGNLHGIFAVVYAEGEEMKYRLDDRVDPFYGIGITYHCAFPYSEFDHIEHNDMLKKHIKSAGLWNK